MLYYIKLIRNAKYKLILFKLILYVSFQLDNSHAAAIKMGRWSLKLYRDMQMFIKPSVEKWGCALIPRTCSQSV